MCWKESCVKEIKTHLIRKKTNERSETTVPPFQSIRPVANSFAKVVYCGAAFLPFCLFCRVSSAAAAAPTPPTKASKTKGNGNEPSKVPPDQPANQPTAAFNCIKVVRQWKRRRRRLGQRDRLGVRRVTWRGDGSSSGRGKAKSLGASH